MTILQLGVGIQILFLTPRSRMTEVTMFCVFSDKSKGLNRVSHVWLKVPRESLSLCYYRLYNKITRFLYVECHFLTDLRVRRPSLYKTSNHCIFSRCLQGSDCSDPKPIQTHHTIHRTRYSLWESRGVTVSHVEVGRWTSPSLHDDFRC